MKFHPRVLEAEQFKIMKQLVIEYGRPMSPLTIVKILTCTYRMELMVILKNLKSCKEHG